MRYLVAAVALAPFVFLLYAMATKRARVQACCAPTSASGSPHQGVLDAAEAGGPTRRHPRFGVSRPEPD